MTMSLLEEISLPLTVLQPPAGPRFAEVFRETWLRLPIDVRITILRFWNDDQGARVLLLNDKDHKIHGRPVLGMCDSSGRSLTFHPRLERCPNLLPRVIAHELAHVYRYATVDSVVLTTEGDETCERLTNDLATKWGLGSDEIAELEWQSASCTS